MEDDPEHRASSMHSAFSGFVLDPEKCSRLSLGEKRELVHEIAQWSEEASEMLSSFSRKELIDMICAELGEERKYRGYAKSRLIKRLLKSVSEKSNSNINSNTAFSPAKVEIGKKRKQSTEASFQPFTDRGCVSMVTSKVEHVKFQICKNAACRAPLSSEQIFCKRCSCCICHRFDDNKDPSLWLTCDANTVDENGPCGISCHLECALKHKRAGIMKNGCCSQLDGNFYCIACGKVNDLMRTWRKQLVIAREARRVDVLCLRLSLSHRILLHTKKFQKLQNTVETAIKRLNDEVGPLEQVCGKMARGIVNRLSCGADIQKLCISAVESLDSMSSDHCSVHLGKKELATCCIQFEESSPSSVIVVLEYEDRLFNNFLGCRLWHRKSDEKDYPDQPSFIVLRPEKKFAIADLQPATEYFCKVSLFSNTETFGVWEAKWMTPAGYDSSVALQKQTREENTVIGQILSQAESTNSTDINGDHPVKFPSSNGNCFIDQRSYLSIDKNQKKELYPPPRSMGTASLIKETLSPLTPSKSNGIRKAPSLKCSKRLDESDYEYSVQAIKWLEHEGHIDEDFRVKFLTWFSLKATMQERRVVRVYVDTFIDDPSSLARQLIHTFLEEICFRPKEYQFMNIGLAQGCAIKF
ncbi:VIN3-like protein 2 [Argentina anserina]|uniref:VIN3-like protein 2 n=1 Tax=Argentina anserina TaxID=57926 RepID=UPI0021767376|nr:VIN3-like protein 2 [Potentilla anserina]